MGMKNRQRRAQRQRERQRQARSAANREDSHGNREYSQGWTAGRSGQAATADLVFALIDLAAGSGTLPESARAHLHLLAREDSRGLADILGGTCVRAVRELWEEGWQPADLARVCGRRLTASHRSQCAAAIGAEQASGGGNPPPDWAAQLAEVGEGSDRSGPGAFAAERFRADSDLAVGAVELLGMLSRLPTLPRLVPPPSVWRLSVAQPVASPPADGADARLLARVRALLAKAESTDFDEEAEALTAKAQELISRHAIDAAALAGSAPAPAAPEVTGRRVAVDDPYAAAKAMLLDRVAGANRARSVWSGRLGFATVFATAADHPAVDILYTSLLAQATRALLRAGAAHRQYRLPSFRQSFLVAFATRIGERLADADGTVTADAVRRHGGSLLPVLAATRTAVDDAVTTTHPDLVSHNVATTNGWGWAQGRAAADFALLSPAEAIASTG